MGIKVFEDYVRDDRHLHKENGEILADIEGHNWPEHLKNDLLIITYRYYNEKSKNENHQNILTEQRLKELAKKLEERQKTSSYWD